MYRLSSSIGLVLSAALLAAFDAYALEIEKSAALSLGSYYSTNICRSPIEEEGKLVGTATPGVQLTGDGPRLNFSLLAAAEYNSVADSDLECPQGGGANLTNREAWVPRLNFAGEYEAWANTLFLESDAFASQNAINPFRAGGEDNINATGNTNITYRWGAGARIDRRLGQNWSVFTRYNYNEQFNSFSQALSDSQEDRVELDIGMIPETSRFSVGIRGDYSEVRFEETAVLPEFTNRLSRLELRSAVNLNRSWQLNGALGEEDNEFVSISDEVDGSYWDAGLRWTPNSRLTADVGWGERFFGDTPRASVAYRHKRSSFSAEYQKTLQFPRNIRAADGSNSDGLLGPGFGADPLPGDGGPTFLGQRPVLNESFSLTYGFEARLTRFDVRASVSEQARAAVPGTADFRSVRFRAERALSRSTGLSFQVTYLDNQGNLLSIDDPAVPGVLQAREQWGGALSVSRSIARRASLLFTYRYIDQDSDTPNNTGNFNTFEEHVFSINLNFSFGSP